MRLPWSQVAMPVPSLMLQALVPSPSAPLSSSISMQEMMFSTSTAAAISQAVQMEAMVLIVLITRVTRLQK